MTSHYSTHDDIAKDRLFFYLSIKKTFDLDPQKVRTLLEQERLDLTQREKIMTHRLHILQERHFGSSVLRGSEGSEIEEHNLLACLLLLMEYGANPSTPNRCYNQTLLHSACDMSWLAGAEALLKNGADPNAMNDHGQTPLSKVGQTKFTMQGFSLHYHDVHFELFNLLLKYGANAMLCNKKGETLFDRFDAYQLTSEKERFQTLYDRVVLDTSLPAVLCSDDSKHLTTSAITEDSALPTRELPTPYRKASFKSL